MRDYMNSRTGEYSRRLRVIGAAIGVVDASG
jgi:hypothetical protein